MNANASSTLTVEERLNRLEAENRSLTRHCQRSRLIQGGLGMMIVVLITVGAAQSQSGYFGDLVCRHFVLQDETGATRISMGSQPDGTVDQSFYDKDGKLRINTFVDNDNTCEVALTDENHAVRAALFRRTNGAARLSFGDRTTSSRVGIGTTPGGAPILEFRDPSGEVMMTLPLPTDLNSPQ